MAPSTPTSTLSTDYPWTTSPLVASAPMLRIALAPLATSVSLAGGLGFLAAGFAISGLEEQLQYAREELFRHHNDASAFPDWDPETDPLPIGVGFLNWGASLPQTLDILSRYPVSAVWFYAPYKMSDLRAWSDGIRRIAPQGKTKIWIQVGSVELALLAAETCNPDVIVAQGCDAGGHGLARGASAMSLVPEVVDAFRDRAIPVPVVAAGGIVDGRGVAASLALGAEGVVLGTRFLVAREAEVRDGYRTEVIRAADGGVNTVRSTVYDRARGIYEWPEAYDGRGIINQSYVDAKNGVDEAEIRRLYDQALRDTGAQARGPEGRLCTYAGTGVGLIKEVTTAGEIVKEVTADAIKCLERTARAFKS